MRLPEGLAWLRASDEGRTWLAALPGLVAASAERWSLQLGEPYPYAFASLALPAVTAKGDEVVLKIQFPDRESQHEAAALRHWDGDGAVRLVDHDGPSHALLLERCVPGTPLAAIGPDDALDVFVGLLPRLWKPAVGPFTPLAEEAAQWAAHLPEEWDEAGRPFDRRLLDAATDALGWLPTAQGDPVLLNQDLHADNVLRAAREPWLVIDPKPLVGEREFGIAPIVRGAELGETRDDVLHRLDRLSAELGLDRDRALWWTLAQTLAWSFDGDGALAWHVQVSRWLLEVAP